MNTTYLIIAVIAAILTLWFGRVFYRSSKIIGLIGVILGAFVAIWFGLIGLGYTIPSRLVLGFVLSGILALISLLCGSCAQKKTCTKHNTCTRKNTTTNTTKTNASYAAASANINVTNNSGHTDDLKKIEGIGPVLEKFLHNNGMRTFNDVANTSPANLKEILNQEKKFAIHNPESWPEQAFLCAQGKWDKLTSMQEELKGGRKA